MTENRILEAVGKRLGIESLNPLQLAVNASTASRLIILAPTGSGKTIAFTLAMLRDIDSHHTGVKAVVIAPSRELVTQIADVVRQAALPMKTLALYGGHNFVDERNSLSVTPDIIIATPGRLLDHINRGTLGVLEPEVIVLDEYDKALELGFHDEMRRVVRRLGHPRRTILTSATPLVATPDFVDLTGAETVDFSDTTQPDISVARVLSPERDKFETLVKLLEALPDGKTIVFVNHRESAERVYNSLRRKGFPAALYHGGLDQSERERALIMADNGSAPILVATDLASRGLDLDSVRSIIHYHMPVSAEAWTHRNGRTARAGASGDVYVITAPDEKMPDYIIVDRESDISKPSDQRIRASRTTLYIDAGKKEKISRGDIAGYLIAAGNLAPEAIGRITVKDHASYTAVDRNVAGTLLEAVKGRKLKHRRVRVSVVKA